ncbi:haloacid dehalogenase superfamily, subfamily IA, variant 3 with third motif having DD or ED [Nonomuraea maritima]|uniref:Haloacid dehalogenase superfamily, subfamily IA, variant 3 with third motif having DD or ED n=1 Tax=Nonomuraea maritima TaxID=683260 RepID=A0A1G9PI85_9ACTN|nr:HAD family phosphatase [Nonomuraea maritima]SDL98201.1 haloacid dehalogenase superfamily, subfamily IA, variant 3 with third motif having DD or ED [Nonomuraea maritima]
MPAPDAVLLDMDGTLVDTEGLWWEAVASVAESLGRPLSAADTPHVHGRTIEDVAAYLLPDGRDAAAMTERLTDAFAERLAGELPVVPGAPELLAGLAAAEIPTALVSASPRSIVELVLPRLGHAFDLVIANEDTPRGKPHPDPYLEAARRLGAAPGRCVVLEDSPAGVAAATAAGCRVLVVSPHDGLPPAEHVYGERRADERT